MPVLEVSAADQILIATGDTSIKELWDATPRGLYLPFPKVELPGGLDGMLKRGGFAQNFFFGSELLGIDIKTAKGKIIKAGGRVVKNVQGYDLTRPFVGSFGTLGDVHSATLRLRPGRSSIMLRKKAEGQMLDNVAARLIWSDPQHHHIMHFGHPKDLEKLQSQWGGQAHDQFLDYSSLFSQGMGVGGSIVQDLRFGWGNHNQTPPVPALFEPLVQALREF